MKIFPALYFATAILILPTSLFAQDKPRENRMVFPPGATVPAETETNPNPGQLKLDPAPGKAIGDFFLALRKKQIDEAYATLTKGSKIAEKPEDVATLKKQTKKALDLFGEIQGYELIQVHPVGSRLLRVTCLSLGRDLPLRWRFYFYRGESDWKLVDLGVDDRLVDLFEETQQAASQGNATQQ
jgi:hypothetical protein